MHPIVAAVLILIARQNAMMDGITASMRMHQATTETIALLAMRLQQIEAERRSSEP